MAEITFVTSDGQKVKAKLEAMKQCKPVETFYTENKPETEMPLPKVSNDALTKIIKFCEQYQEKPLPVIEKPIKSNKIEEVIKDEWLCKFLDLSTKDIYELLMASDYMALKKLEDLISCAVAIKIYGKSIDDVRKDFGVTNDFTPDEEKELQQFFNWIDDIWP